MSNVVRKRYIRRTPRWEGNFTITQEMVGTKIKSAHKCGSPGRGRPYGLLGYTITRKGEETYIRVAYSVAHHNDEFSKQIAHKVVDERIVDRWASYEFLLNNGDERYRLAKYVELPDAVRELALVVYDYESEKLTRPIPERSVN